MDEDSSSQLKETFNFEKIKRHQEIVRRNIKTSFKNLEMQLGQIFSQLTLKLRSSGDFYENIFDSPKDMEFEREVKQKCEVFDEGGVEETLTQFIKITQINFGKINKQKETLQRDMEASFENLAMQLGLVSSQLTLKLSSSGELNGKILDSPEIRKLKENSNKNVRSSMKVELQKRKKKKSAHHLIKK